MDQDAPEPGKRLPIAIVGGGAAGTLIALQLAERGIATTVFDRRTAFGRGVAYSATAPWHRLNVPIDKMGGWRADDSDQAFHAWYVAQHGPLPARYSDRYVARSAYGAWLRHELDRVVAAGLVELRPEEIVSIAEIGAAVRLGFAGGAGLTERLAVLCLGNQKPRTLAIAPPGRTVADMWAPGAMDGIAGKDPVLIVGTGATGIDALLELYHRGHQGTIYLLSRRGLLPLVDAPPKAYTIERTIVDAAPRLRDVVARLRREAEEAGAEGHAWQSVVDAFRADLPRLWDGLSEADRSRFLRHLRPYWLIHRHRLTPDIAELLDRLRAEGRLVVVRGRLRAAREGGDGLVVDIARRGSGPVSLPVGWLINCTGPEEDFRRLADPLAGHLLRSGMARPGAFGVGLDVDGEARLLRADGTPHARLFVLGNATRSRFGEVTSAPQIRRRAASLARTIASALHEAEHRT
jgi:uncharacterized NAD(P)/FAD-binding protein YdhS